MKKIRNLFAAATLLAVLSVSTLAGEISTGVVTPPPQAPPASALPVSGDGQSGETEIQIQSNDLITEVTLSLLQLLSVF